MSDMLCVWCLVSVYVSIISSLEDHLGMLREGAWAVSLFVS